MFFYDERSKINIAHQYSWTTITRPIHNHTDHQNRIDFIHVCPQAHRTAMLYVYSFDKLCHVPITPTHYQASWLVINLHISATYIRHDLYSVEYLPSLRNTMTRNTMTLPGYRHIGRKPITRLNNTNGIAFHKALHSQFSFSLNRHQRNNVKSTEEADYWIWFDILHS